MLDQVAELTAHSVDLLYWDGCPSHPDALRLLRALLHDLGRDDVRIRFIRVETDEQAQQLRFPGSPTLRVNGRELVAAEEGTDFGLTCRLYRLRDGRPSPTPDPEILREGLRAAFPPAGDQSAHRDSLELRAECLCVQHRGAGVPVPM
jgi:hypothetical protein